METTAGSRETIATRDIDGRTLFIVDGLFDAPTVRLLHESFVRLPFTQSDFDTEATRHVRHWKFEFDPQGLEQSPVLRPWSRRVIATASRLLGAASLPIRRIYCNNVNFGDHQHLHVDGPDGTTALYFANAEWSPDWQGETLFCDSDGEPCSAVAPRPGRLVLFPSDCLHRSGVPAKTCLEPRLTVAFQFAPAPAGA